MLDLAIQQTRRGRGAKPRVQVKAPGYVVEVEDDSIGEELEATFKSRGISYTVSKTPPILAKVLPFRRRKEQ